MLVSANRQVLFSSDNIIIVIPDFIPIGFKSRVWLYYESGKTCVCVTLGHNDIITPAWCSPARLWRKAEVPPSSAQSLSAGVLVSPLHSAVLEAQRCRYTTMEKEWSQINTENPLHRVTVGRQLTTEQEECVCVSACLTSRGEICSCVFSSVTA